MTVRDVVVSLLKQTGMTQKEFARKAGVTVGCVSSTLSKDDGNNMKVSTLVRWLDALGSQLVIDSVVEFKGELILDLEPEDVDYDNYRLSREERQERRRLSEAGR